MDSIWTTGARGRLARDDGRHADQPGVRRACAWISGGLKALSPELVQEVNLINGPFNAQYGDLSGLGVVTIRTRTEMPDRLTARAQFGQFNTRRIFAAYSPQSDRSGTLIANEYSYQTAPLSGHWSTCATM